MERPNHPEAGPDEDVVAAVRRRLLRQAFVFEDPAAYAAGVEDALAAITALQGDGGDLTAGSVERVERTETGSTRRRRPTILHGAAG